VSVKFSPYFLIRALLPLDLPSIMTCKPAIASMSLGRAWVHELPNKLTQARNAGFRGIEIFFEDLEYLAKSYGELTTENQLKAAEEIRKLCDERDLTIIGLQPFLFYEGLIDREEHKKRIEKLHVWFRIAKILGTDTIQIPTNFQVSGISGDMDLIVQDMIEVADLGSKQSPVVRFAYENLAWGTFVDTWEKVWEIVQRVDRPNFGMCLDTFNIVGRVWADPASPTGKTPNAEEFLKRSIERLVKTVDIRKVFYIQVVDAERMESPLVEGHAFYVEGQPSRMSWSRNARLFLYEQDKGGYMPVVDVARAFIEGLGYVGWVSMELFSRTMADPAPETPKAHAERGIRSWKKLVEELSLKVE
jgi:4-hydroxyphenylpyruvate dioxygenase